MENYKRKNDRSATATTPTRRCDELKPVLDRIFWNLFKYWQCRSNVPIKIQVHQSADTRNHQHILLLNYPSRGPRRNVSPKIHLQCYLAVFVNTDIIRTVRFLILLRRRPSRSFA